MSDKSKDQRIESVETSGMVGDLCARPRAKADPYPPGLGPKKLDPLPDEVPRTHPMLRDFPETIGVPGVYLFTLERVEVEQVVARNIDTRDFNAFAEVFDGVIRTLKGEATRTAIREYLSMTRRLRVTWLLTTPDTLRSAFDESVELGAHTFDADGAPNDAAGWAKLVAGLVEASRREASAYVEDLILRGANTRKVEGA